jgi:hypothetical protein
MAGICKGTRNVPLDASGRRLSYLPPVNRSQVRDGERRTDSHRPCLIPPFAIPVDLDGGVGSGQPRPANGCPPTTATSRVLPVTYRDTLIDREICCSAVSSLCHRPRLEHRPPGSRWLALSVWALWEWCSRRPPAASRRTRYPGMPGDLAPESASPRCPATRNATERVNPPNPCGFSRFFSSVVFGCSSVVFGCSRKQANGTSLRPRFS